MTSRQQKLARKSVSKPTSELVIEEAGWKHPAELIYSTGKYWTDKKLLYYCILTALSVDTARESPELCYVSDGKKTIVLSSKYRIPILFASRWQWTKLKSILTAEKEERKRRWAEEKFEILHIARVWKIMTDEGPLADSLNSNYGKEQRVDVIKRWRCHTLDRVLTRFRMDCFSSEPGHVENFWEKHQEREYTQDTLEFDWRSWLSQSRDGVSIQQSELTTRVDPSQLMFGLKERGGEWFWETETNQVPDGTPAWALRQTAANLFARPKAQSSSKASPSPTPKSTPKTVSVTQTPPKVRRAQNSMAGISASSTNTSPRPLSTASTQSTNSTPLLQSPLSAVTPSISSPKVPPLPSSSPTTNVTPASTQQSTATPSVERPVFGPPRPTEPLKIASQAHNKLLSDNNPRSSSPSVVPPQKAKFSLPSFPRRAAGTVPNESIATDTQKSNTPLSLNDKSNGVHADSQKSNSSSSIPTPSPTPTISSSTALSAASVPAGGKVASTTASARLSSASPANMGLSIVIPKKQVKQNSTSTAPSTNTSERFGASAVASDPKATFSTSEEVGVSISMPKRASSSSTSSSRAQTPTLSSATFAMPTNRNAVQPAQSSPCAPTPVSVGNSFTESVPSSTVPHVEKPDSPVLPATSSSNLDESTKPTNSEDIAERSEATTATRVTADHESPRPATPISPLYVNSAIPSVNSTAATTSNSTHPASVDANISTGHKRPASPLEKPGPSKIQVLPPPTQSTAMEMFTEIPGLGIVYPSPSYTPSSLPPVKGTLASSSISSPKQQQQSQSGDARASSSSSTSASNQNGNIASELSRQNVRYLPPMPLEHLLDRDNTKAKSEVNSPDSLLFSIENRKDADNSRPTTEVETPLHPLAHLLR